MRKFVSSCRMQVWAAGWQPEEGKGWGELGRVERELGWVIPVPGLLDTCAVDSRTGHRVSRLGLAHPTAEIKIAAPGWVANQGAGRRFRRPCFQTPTHGPTPKKTSLTTQPLVVLLQRHLVCQTGRARFTSACHRPASRISSNGGMRARRTQRTRSTLAAHQTTHSLNAASVAQWPRSALPKSCCL